ncbi:TorF family putative porin [Glaciecola sp. SC05]|uniref:TorF family putative porin n=1 Tax=Glaciecola sp. SC05 TaxID=1987355 RepID=UPI0035284A20
MSDTKSHAAHHISKRKPLGFNVVINVLILLALLSTFNLKAEETISASLAIESDFLWRGFDLNNGKPSLQAGLDYEQAEGFSASLWAYQYDFGDSDDGILIDIYGAYTLPLFEDASLELGLYRYEYSGESEASTEYFVGLSYLFLTLRYLVDDDLGTKYLEFEFDYDIFDEWELNLRYGINDDGFERYYDYLIGFNTYINDYVNIKAGYSNHEFDEEGAQGTLFLGITGYL